MMKPEKPITRPGQAATLLAVGLLSVAMLSFELTLTRLFAVAQFYHFAFMVISLALLGAGASGSLLAVWPRLGRHPARWAAGFGLAALGSYAILNLIPFDSYAIAWERRQVIFLLLTFAGTAAPFLFSGLVVGGLLAADRSAIHQVYAANLLGSAVGCLAPLALLEWLGGEGALFVSAALGLASAALFAWEHFNSLEVTPQSSPRSDLPPFAKGGGRSHQAVRGVQSTPQRKFARFFKHDPGSRRGHWWTVGLGLAAAGLVTLGLTQPGWAAIRLSPYKGLYQARLAPGAEHLTTEWNIQARVDTVASESIHILPGLSQNALISRPPLQAGLTLDGDNLQPVTALEPDDELARTLAGYVPGAVITALRPDPGSLLILEPGGGWEALMALAGGAADVTVVERNPLVIDLLADPSGLALGLYADPRITVVRSTGRAYLSQSGRSYDVIAIALSDSFHPVTSGAYSLGEDYRYTVEGIGDALDRLNPGGLLVITRWLQTPPTESLRALAAAEAALRDRGVAQPGDHLAAFRSLRTMTLVVKTTPVDDGERVAIRDFAAAQGYDLVWLPDITPGEVNRRSRLPEPAYYRAFAALLADPEGFIRGYEFDIRPPVDDRPFFYHYFRWRQTPQVLAELGRTWQPFGGSGYFVLVALLGLVTLLAALAILGPLVVGRLPEIEGGGRGLRGGPRGRILVYFFMLGLAFLLVEIGLAQRFVLFLGAPVIAFSVVLFGLLLFSGLGSLSAPRWQLRNALGLLIGAAALTTLGLGPVFDLALGWPLAARMAVAVLSLMPLGLLMGVPFARGMAHAEAALPGIAPWAWAINGSASVISGVLAMMIALSWGYSVVLWLGAAAYAVALVVGVDKGIVVRERESDGN